MARLEELSKGALVEGLVSGEPVTIVSADWQGPDALELFYKTASGRPDSQIVYRHHEPRLTVGSAARAWDLAADGRLLRLASEAHRIRLAHLFDPLLAVSTSLVEPLPHQITAVYEEMLARRPLRFLLADDPGAGKTIMAGLLIKELIARGDLERCLIVCPGSLVEQWQDELHSKFGLGFEILTNDKLAAARTGNWLAETPLAIARLDKLSRDEDLQAKLDATDWDLVVVDEAHKMAATRFGNEVKYTRRYALGQRLSGLTRHLLLMTATPHNGKDDDFRLFMALLDPDRFEGRDRAGHERPDATDLMRRLVKEDLLKFDGRPLFPERVAHTVPYSLTPAEAELYEAVTDYVRDEFNRADALENDGRRGTVGFALTVLQRRLASSPEAIYQSLRRRQERLERRLAEERLLRPRAGPALDNAPLATAGPILEDFDPDDPDDHTDAEVEAAEERVVDQASAARTIVELEHEISTLERLVQVARRVRDSRSDRKWDELSRLLQDETHMFDPSGARRKLIVFTEHRDTLDYLVTRIAALLGKPEAVVIIHGGVSRDDRQRAQAGFNHDPAVQVLVATDAAGEGINLQRGHLMVNYDLPWNPNRLEQRFGRIHRIGQTEVCHLWNLVADQTREGDVFRRLFEKLERSREALGGRVFDVLGKLSFEDRPLRELLLEAVRYGNDPAVRARLEQAVDNAVDREHLTGLLEERALARDTMDASRVRRIREDMERAEARRLQPHFVASFFREAWRELGGSLHAREPGRFEITRVPALVRSRERTAGREPVLDRYERVTFDKNLISLPGRPTAAFLSPGHPLLDAVTGLTLERHRSLLGQGAALVDPTDPGEVPRALFFLESTIEDGRLERSGARRVASRKLVFLEIDAEGSAREAGPAPYLDYRPLEDGERGLLEAADLPDRAQLESRVVAHAVERLLPEHLEEVRASREPLLERTRAAVTERLNAEINHWDHRATELLLQQQAGRQPRMNPANARARADDLEARRDRRLRELDEEKLLSQRPPVLVGAALVIPAGLLARLRGESPPEPTLFARETARVERLGMEAVAQAERELGFEPRDVSREKCGYDIESRVPDTGKLRFIEVKGRVHGAETVTVTRNEILVALNKPDDFILALVEVHGDRATARYLRRPFVREPDAFAESVNYDLPELIARAGAPS